jgi:hypothetical protein
LLTNYLLNIALLLLVYENRNRSVLSESYYICDKSNMILQSELIHDPLFPDRKNILEQFTEFTFRMHEASINFLDHSPGNTLIVKKGKSILFS